MQVDVLQGLGLLETRPLVDVLRQEKVTLDEIERIRDDAVRRGAVVVIEKEDVEGICELLDLEPGASFTEIVIALRALIATYQRTHGLPVVRLVPPRQKPN